MIHIKSTLFTILICCFSIITKAEIFKGTIGKYPITISFSITDIGKYSDKGGYFYESKRQKIIFTEASGTENHILLEVGYDDTNIEKFDLVKNANGSYKGTWENKKNKLPVQLVPINLKTIKNVYLNDWNDELWYLASSKLIFNLDTTIFVGKHEIEWFKDNIYGISFFKIGSDKNKGINKYLKNTHLELIESKFSGCSCDNDDFEPFEISEVGRNILRFSFQQGICYCYSAAHPGWSEITKNLDLEKDEIIDFDNLFSFTKIVVPNRDKDYLKWVDFKTKYVAPKIVEFLKKNDKTLLPTPKNYERQDDGNCYYLENEYWENLENWQLNKKSIIIKHFELSRGYGPCMQSFELPYHYFIPYLKPDYKDRVFININ